MSDQVARILEWISAFIIGGGLLKLYTLSQDKESKKLDNEGKKIENEASTNTEYKAIIEYLKEENAKLSETNEKQEKRIDEIWNAYHEMNRRLAVVEGALGKSNIELLAAREHACALATTCPRHEALPEPYIHNSDIIEMIKQSTTQGLGSIGCAEG